VQRKICLIIVALCAAAAAGWAATAALMSVQVKKADVRDTPSFLGNIVSSLDYGARVSVDQENGAWFRVTNPDGTAAGWLHTSALTKKTIVMQAGSGAGGGAQTAASSGEMALAGKGFNADIEKEFKAGHKNIDFKCVDRMEAIKITPAALKAFVKEGGLAAPGGAR